MTDANTPDPETATPTSRAESMPDALPVDEAARVTGDVVENVEKVIVGHHDEVEHVVTAILARGHVLLEDVPGVGKTMLARSVAKSVDCSFRRVQFTPDLLPSDVTGVNVFNQKTREFEFRPGPVFANIVLGDEINRAPPKTQSSLLEAMEEQQVTVDGTTRSVPTPFTVIATQNSVEPSRTYELPIAELDRFMKKIHLGYPETDEETEMVGRVVGVHPIEDLEPVTDLDRLRRAISTVADVTVEESVRDYATRLTGYTRKNATLGASPRGTIAVLRAAQARAVLDGRDYVVPDDVQTEAPSVLSHRIRVSASDERAGGPTVPGDSAGRTLVEEALERVPIQ
jgi:MoxR-like ATPase